VGAVPAPSRLGELEGAQVPVLIVQGERDPFGMPPAGPLRQVVVVQGDHSLRGNAREVTDAVSAWLPGLAIPAP
jgi:predicted alpha/beta-hydrolase family hydrolase